MPGPSKIPVGSGGDFDLDSALLALLTNNTVLGRVSDAIAAISAASQAEMETGSETALRAMSPLRIKQAVDAHADAQVDDAILTILSSAGDKMVRNASNALVRLPIGITAMAADEIDFAAGKVFTKTISGSTTFTAANDTWGHQSVLLILAVSGGPAAPTWPGTTTVVGAGVWSTSATNYCFLTRTGTGTYIVSYAQA